MRRGAFITLEGGEGSGKSTQARLLAEALASHGLPVLLTREPGGSPRAERIRTLLVEGDGDAWEPHAELLLFTAARAEHWRKVILPALEVGTHVICDRFVDSTVAYQGAGHGISERYIRELTRLAIGPCMPSLTLWLDIPVEEGLRRAGTRKGGEGRFEALDTAFHTRVASHFAAIAAREPHRVCRIEAIQEVEAVAARIAEAVRERLGL